MILRHTKRTVPQLNTTSTADISFILLVFFLMMTSMDVDKGLSRTLPPIQDDSSTEVTEISRDNVLSITLTPSGSLLVDGKPSDIGRLRSHVATFVGKTADRRRHMLMIDVDRRAPYDSYFQVQNEVIAAYNALRDAYARRKYGRSYVLCTSEQRKAVRDYYPQHITETTTDSGEGGGR